MVDIGLIGAGNIAAVHLPAYRQYPERVRLAGVCDAREERAAEVAGEFETSYWTDYEDFVAESDVDAVDITLPHHLHYDAARTALEAGKHVLLEKPFATSMEHCRDLVQLADDRDLTLMVGQMQRFHPAYRGLAEAVNDGAFGQIRHARVDVFVNQADIYPPSHWLYDGNRAGGGSVISYAVHKLDLLRYLVGDVERAVAWGATVDPAFEDAEDHAGGLLEFETGAHADFFTAISAAAMPYNESFWLYGDDGMAHTLPRTPQGEDYVGMPEPVVNAQPGSDARKDFDPLEAGATDLPTDDAFVNEILHFADAVESGEEPLSSGTDNLRTMATIFAIYRSMAAAGEPVDVADVIAGREGEGP